MLRATSRWKEAYMKGDSMKKSCVVWMVAMIAGMVQAGEIFNDYDATGFANWYKGDAALGTLNKADEIKWTENGSAVGQESIGRSFTATNLAVGETLKLTFDYTQTNYSATTIRVGLFNTASNVTAGFGGTSTTAGQKIGNYTGYYSVLYDNSTSANLIRRESQSGSYGWAGCPLGGGTVAAVTNYTQQYDIVNDGSKTYQAVYQMTRTSADGLDFSFALWDGATNVQEVKGTYNDASIITNFNAVFFRSSAATAGASSILDNVQLQVIPEPATIGMLGLGALITFGIRRKFLA
jgi:hypothetical protein